MANGNGDSPPWKGFLGPLLTVSLAVGGAYGVTQFERGVAQAERAAYEARLKTVERWAERTEATRFTSREGDGVMARLSTHEQRDWHPKAGESISTLEALVDRHESRIDRIEREHNKFKKKATLNNRLNPERKVSLP